MKNWFGLLDLLFVLAMTLWTIIAVWYGEYSHAVLPVAYAVGYGWARRTQYKSQRELGKTLKEWEEHLNAQRKE